MINCFQVETFLDFDKSSQGIVFTTDRSYQPGEQVTLSFIPLALFSVIYQSNELTILV